MNQLPRYPQQSIYFGGGSHLHEYTHSRHEDYYHHTRLVQRSEKQRGELDPWRQGNFANEGHWNGEHDNANPHHRRHFGRGAGVTFNQPIPPAAQQGLTYAAYEDVRDWFPPPGTRDSRGAIPKRYQPGAIGSYQAPGSVTGGQGVMHGYQMYTSSSSKGTADPVTLEPGLSQRLMEDNDGVMPTHRRDFQCTEANNLSDYGYANPGAWGHEQDDTDDGRFFVVHTGNRRRMAPCGHSEEEYGCSNISDAVRTNDLGDFTERDWEVEHLEHLEEHDEDELAPYECGPRCGIEAVFGSSEIQDTLDMWEAHDDDDGEEDNEEDEEDEEEDDDNSYDGDDFGELYSEGSGVYGDDDYDEY